MLDALIHNREQYAQGYVTQLDNGELIPWSPLSVGEFLKYEKLLLDKKYPAAYIENEIFRKCVLNPYLAEHLDRLNAGVISTVVQGIMAYSAPKTIEQVANLLNEQRIKVGGLLHDFICIICQAFPAYKPDELYAMDAETLMERVALAERKLLSTGLLTAPLSIDGPSEKQPKKKIIPREVKKPQVNLAQKYQEQSVPQTIITKRDTQEQQELAYTGHEKTDRIVREQEMLQSTVPVYQEYLDQLKKDGKITIKTPEERKAIAIQRAKQNEQRFNEMVAKKKQEDELATKMLAEHRQIKRAKRKIR